MPLTIETFKIKSNTVSDVSKAVLIDISVIYQKMNKLTNHFLIWFEVSGFQRA